MWRLLGCSTPCKPPVSTFGTEKELNTVRVDPSLTSTLQSAEDSVAKPVPVSSRGAESFGNSRTNGPVMDQLKQAAKGWLGQLTEISLEYPYADLAKATNNFDRKQQLGSGAAGTVYRGVLAGGTEVAVKVLRDQGGLEGFEEEVRFLSRFRHPNVVTLFGWGQKQSEKLLIYEVLDGGDLFVKLKKSQGKDPRPFTWAHRLPVALDAARGLSHMVNSTPMAFHRDIKSANILLDSNGTAKIADFGLAGLVDESQSGGRRQLSVRHISGTPGYACPIYSQTGRVTEQSEVYSFGIVLLELLLNQPPCLMGREGDLVYPILQVVQPAAPGAHARLMANLDPGADWPRRVVEDFGDLALACVDMKPERRPSFENIVRTLHRLVGASAGFHEDTS
eukprot:TRINITY_DN67569_c0_g1_i1.p1 TRINITY_DN67569_c0_g1~~TRINITY_DN67569_c0_g1_i1.p1  ORF type:complete len:392 (-),score=46.93 TRINITY_DN67569_c0_g1_i1:94-1269(-)